MYRRILASAMLLVASKAKAFFDPPWITPTTPRAGDIVSVNIRSGICDAIFEHAGFPQIERHGNSIRLLEYGHHWETDDLCIYDIGQTVEPIGVFQPGEYTVTVNFIYEDYPFGYTEVTLGTLSFTVRSKEIAPVPSSVPLTSIFLLGGMLWLAFRRIRMIEYRSTAH